MRGSLTDFRQDQGGARWWKIGSPVARTTGRNSRTESLTAIGMTMLEVSIIREGRDLRRIMQTAGPALRITGRTFNIDRTLVMGVVNASPESFSDAGRYPTLDERLALCERLISEGVDMLDVGGQSAITNQPEVLADEEIERVVPIVAWLHANHPDVLVSVDTYKPAVVDAVLRAGASIVNDVSGDVDPRVVRACVEFGAALVIMHTRARPKVRMQDPNAYDDVTRDVVEFLSAGMERAVEQSLPLESIILDPGVDFAKTPHQTVAMLRRLGDVRTLDRPLLLALSRKDFLGAILGKSPRGRDIGTLASVAHFATEVGTIVRVHDVAATREVLDTIDVLIGRRDIDPEYLLPDALRQERPSTMA